MEKQSQGRAVAGSDVPLFCRPDALLCQNFLPTSSLVDLEYQTATMRLIDTNSLELGEFFEPEVPTYVILSHTWEKDELTLREWTEPSTATPSKAGYKKVCMAASLARCSGYAWLWVDTVCIDKTSSAELSEAINSMFNCKFPTESFDASRG